MKLQTRIYNEIDEGFRDIIRTLYRKNYLTQFCCEGHTDKLTKKSERWNGYLVFRHQYDFPIPIPLFPLKETNCFHKGKAPKNKYSITIKDTYYWFGSVGTTIEEKEQERLELMARIKEWADSLPPRKLVIEYLYILKGIDENNNSTFLYYNRKKIDYKDIIEKNKGKFKEFKEEKVELRRY